MSTAMKRDLVRQFLAGAISRREFVAGTLAIGLTAGSVSGGLASGGPHRTRGPRAAQEEADAAPLTDEMVTFRVLVPASAHVEDFETNAFTAWYEERTNVHIEWEVVPSQEAQTSLNLRLASGNYPDIIMHFNPAPALQMLYGSQGIFLPLNDLIAQHGTHFNEVIEAYPLTLDAITATDGNIYSIPQVNDCYHCSLPQKLWIYRPWLEELGLDMPTTTEEFAEVMRAFKERDPNGSGQADEVPLISSTLNSFDMFFMNSFIYNSGAIDDRLIVREGTVEAAYVSPEWREGLAYLAGLYAEGLIAPESFTQDVDQLRLLGNNDDPPIVGSAPALFPGHFMDIDSLAGGRWTDYVTVPPLEGPNGTRYAAHDPYQPFMTGNFIITNVCEDPELAFRWADGLYELETTLRSVFGLPGEDWRWAEEWEVGIDGRPALWRRLSPFGQVQNNSWRQTGPSFRSNDTRLGEAIDPEEAGFNLEAILYRETSENYAPYAQPVEMTVPPLFFSEEQAQQVAELGTTINDYVEETLALTITGQVAVDDAGWESYLATLESMGLAQYLAIHQDAYDARA